MSNAAFLPVGLAGSLLAIRAARAPYLDPRTRGAWSILAVAFTLFWAGDVTWLVYENVLGIEPFPSAADALYLAFYPLAMWGFLRFPAGGAHGSSRLKFWLDAGTVLLGGWMIVWYFVLGPTASASGASVLESALSIAYPVGDLLVLFGAAAVILRRPAAASRRALMVLAAGAILFVAADVAYGHRVLTDTYRSGDWTDTLWMLAQLCLVYAACVQVSGAGRAERSADDRPPAQMSRLPYVAVATGYALLIAVARGQAVYPIGGLLIGAVSVTALVLARQITVLRDNARLLGELHQLAVTDGLTGLKNRRHFLELSEREFQIARLYDRPLAAVMLDVDHFKRVNDSYGHVTGDAVLRSVGDSCLEQLRAGDILGRYGGDELVLLLPGSGLGDAERVAERICRAIESRPVRTGDSLVPVTISLGVASASDCTTLEELLRNADAALYAAKAAGRNRSHAARGA